MADQFIEERGDRVGVGVQSELFTLLSARKGHFLLESGHHGDLWLDLELLCLQPGSLRSLAVELARRLAHLDIEVVCGPLIEGAFVALLVASELNVQFGYSERFPRPTKQHFFPAGYRLPDALRTVVRGKRVGIVNDVINAGSAVRGTFEDLERCGAKIAAVGALLVLGTAAEEFAASKAVPLETVAALPNNVWGAEDCPLCAAGIELQDVGGFGTAFGGD